MKVTRRTVLELMGSAGGAALFPKSSKALFASARTAASFSALPKVQPHDYDLIWTSQIRNAGESMLCDGGDIGLNVWVENGDVLCYLSRSGSFDEINSLPKFAA